MRLSRIPFPPSTATSSLDSTPSSSSLTTLSICAQIAHVAKSALGNSDTSVVGKAEEKAEETSVPLISSDSTSQFSLPLVTNSMAAGYDSVVFISAQSSPNSSRLYRSSPAIRSSSPSSPSPTYLTLPYGVDSVACGSHHTLALACGGSVLLSWGSNGCGQLGIGRGGGGAQELGRRDAATYVETPTPVVACDEG